LRSKSVVIFSISSVNDSIFFSRLSTTFSRLPISISLISRLYSFDLYDAFRSLPFCLYFSFSLFSLSSRTSSYISSWISSVVFTFSSMPFSFLSKSRIWLPISRTSLCASLARSVRVESCCSWSSENCSPHDFEIAVFSRSWRSLSSVNTTSRSSDFGIFNCSLRIWIILSMAELSFIKGSTFLFSKVELPIKNMNPNTPAINAPTNTQRPGLRSGMSRSSPTSSGSSVFAVADPRNSKRASININPIITNFIAAPHIFALNPIRLMCSALLPIPFNAGLWPNRYA